MVRNGQPVTELVGGKKQVVMVPQMAGRQALAAIRTFDGESIESALRRFKRQVQQEGIIKDVKKHAFFLKPGERKRLKSKLAQKLKRKKVRRFPDDSDSKAPSRSR